MPYPFTPGEILTSVNLNAALDMRMFSTMTGMGIIPGAVVFGHATSGGFQTDNAGLYYDDVNNRLGVGTNTPQVQFHVGKIGGAALRSYYTYTDPANGSWAYLGDWTKVTAVATYGTDNVGSGVVCDVSILRGGVEMMRLGAYGLTATAASMTYTQPLPVLLGTVALTAAQRACVIMGNYAYTTNQSATGLVDVLEIFDITEPTAPFKVGGLILPNQGLGQMAIAGNYLYIGINSTTAALQVIDVTNPKAPTVFKTLNPAGQAIQYVAISGQYLFLGFGATSTFFRVVDISDPNNLVIKGNATMTGASGIRSIAIQGEYAYATTGQAVAGVGGLYVIDISDLSLSTLPIVATKSPPATGGGLAIADRYLYSCCGAAASGLEVYDISDPLNPVLVTTLPTVGATSSGSDPIIAGNYLFRFQNNVNGIQVIDITNPAAPVSIGYSATVSGVIGAALSGNRLYVCGNSQLRIYNTFGISVPTLKAGSLNADKLYVDGVSYFNSDMYAQRGLVVGQAGILSRGMISTPAIDTRTFSGAAQDYLYGQFVMSGGGTISWIGGKLKWTARFICIPMGRSGAASGGYVQMDQPVVDIPAAQVHNGVARVADANGVTLASWEALYAAHTIGGNQLAVTYYIVLYSTAWIPPSNWLLVAAVNSDTSSIKLGTGKLLYSGETYTPGGPVTIVNSTAATTAALDVDAVLGSTAAKFGSSLALYAIANFPAIGFNGYYNAGWKYGKGSATHYVGTIGFDVNTAIFGLTSSTASGVANAAATMQNVFLVSQAGLITFGAPAAFSAARAALRCGTAIECVTGDQVSYALFYAATPAASSNNNQVATTAYVDSGISTRTALYLPLTGGTLSGGITVTAGNVQLNSGWISAAGTPPSLVNGHVFAYIYANTSSSALVGNAVLDATSTWKYRTATAATVMNNDGGAYNFFTAPVGTIGATVSWTNRFGIGNTGILSNNGVASLLNDGVTTTGYNKIYSGDGTNVALYLGGSTPKTNYYRNTAHEFGARDVDGSGAFFTIANNAVKIVQNYLYFANSTGSVNTTGGPLIYGDANNTVLKIGSGAGAVIVQDYAGVNKHTFSANGQAVHTADQYSTTSFVASAGLNTNQGATISNGGASQAGLLSIFNNVGTRLFYLGYNNTLPELHIDSGGIFQITGGNFQVSAGSIASLGTSAIVTWQNRNGSSSFGWYAVDNRAFLWNSGYGEILAARGDNGFLRLGSSGVAGNIVDIYRVANGDPLTILTDTGLFCRIKYSATRLWTAGQDTIGRFVIADETAGAYRLWIETDATVQTNGNIKGFAYYSNGYLAMTANASHIQHYRPDGNTALYLSNDSTSTNYYRCQNHKFDNGAGSVTWVTIDSAGALNVFQNNMYFNNGHTIVLNNNVHYFGKDTGGTFQPVIGLLSDNWVHIAGGGNTIYTGGVLQTGAHVVPWTNNAQYCGGGVYNAFYACTAYNIVNLSDAREKKDVRDLPGRCLDLVNSIIPKRFRWNNGIDQEREHWGFIAQEVGETMRDAGLDFGGHQVQDNENRSEGLAMHELVAVLWRAVQEMSGRLKVLEEGKA